MAFAAQPAFWRPRHVALSMADESHQESWLLTVFKGCCK